MKKNILIIGVILLVIGIVLGALGPSLFTTSPEKLAADRDQNGLTYNSYSAGDTVTVYGKITYVHQTSFLGNTVYTYELNGDGDSENDGDFGFMSSTDVGSVGDSVVVKLQLQEQGFMGISAEYWETTAKVSPALYMLPGILLAIIGGIMLLVGLVKKDRGVPQPVQGQQYNPQYQQGQPYQQAEQAPPQYQQTAPQPEYYQPPEENQGPPKF